MVRDQLPNFFSSFRFITFRSVKQLSPQIQDWFNGLHAVKAIRAMKESPSFLLLSQYRSRAGHISRIDFAAIRKDSNKLGHARTEKERAMMQAIKEVMSFLENSDYHQSLIGDGFAALTVYGI